MELADADRHQYADTYPCRLPVWWARVGEIGPHIEEDGITGKNVVLRIEKRFTRFERLLAKLFRAPREVRRPLDTMNSMLWELCDGSRNFQSICVAMDEIFHEDIAPAVDRTASGIDSLRTRNMVTCLGQPFMLKWNIGPGQTPKHQTLTAIDEKSGYDIEPRTKAEKNFIEEDQSEPQLDVQSE